LITFSTVRPSRPPRFALFPYTTLFRSHRDADGTLLAVAPNAHLGNLPRSRVGHERGERGGLVHCLAVPGEDHVAGLDAGARGGDRKSTRLNSSHVSISYAVFCLKNKT